MSRSSTHSHPTWSSCSAATRRAYETDRYPYLADEIAAAAHAHRRRGADLRRVPRSPAAREDPRRPCLQGRAQGGRLAHGRAHRRRGPTPPCGTSPACRPCSGTATRSNCPRASSGSPVRRSTRTRRSRGATGCSPCSSTPRSTTPSTRTGSTAWGDELPEYGLSREQLRAERAEYGPPMQEASARLLGEYLDGLARRARSIA